MNTIDRRVRRLEVLQSPKTGARLIVVSVCDGAVDEQTASALAAAGIVQTERDLVISVISFLPREECCEPCVSRVSPL